MINDVKESDFYVGFEEMEAAKVNFDFNKYFFTIKIKPDIVKLISAGDFNNRDQWIRVLLLVVQMNRLQIDFNRVNPFVFETF